MRTEGRSIAGYALLGRLGEGGNGEVWRARLGGDEVAIKILKSSTKKDAVPRFLREIEALKKLQGMSGVLPLLDHCKETNPSAQLWFTMPLATPLSKGLRQADLREICASMAEMANALDRVHRAGISHRDIKPDNLFIHEGKSCLGDFGLADFESTEALTESGRKLGPAYYIAPEMLNSPDAADGFKADIYSLGKSLWVLATDQRYPLPGVHDPTFTPIAIQTFRDDWRSGPLDELLIRMTQLNPEDRPDPESVARELTKLSEEPQSTPPPDASAAFATLRSKLVTHMSREAEAIRQQKLAEITSEKLRAAVMEVAEKIATETNLTPNDWYDLPRLWEPRQNHKHNVLWHDSHGVAFEAGGHRETWRLGIAFKCHLFKDDQLTINIGYSFDRLVLGADGNHFGMPRAWEADGTEINGSASCHLLTERLLADLQSNLPGTIAEYARLVEKASD